MRLRFLIVFLLLLIPSEFYAWKNRDMPDFGRLHDDGLFFVSAKSLATGQGFRILSLPEQPAQTKYPVLYPLYLSLIWRINPHFPENLALATWFCWPLLAICLGLVWIFLRGAGFGETRTWLVVGLLAISPYMILFGCTMFSEMFFLCWLLATLVVARKQGVAMALLAGVLGGLAYLSRTAGIALIVSMPAWYLWRREFRRTLAFAAGMLPFILGWTLWSAAHKFHATDATLVYYTDYVKFLFLNVDMNNLAVVLWKNTDGLLMSTGALVVPRIVDALPYKILCDVIAIAMISGIVRLARRSSAESGVIPYALFALVSSGILITWHFPPTEKFVLPNFPLLLAGLIVELEHVIAIVRPAFRHRDFGQRAVASVFATILVVVFGGALALELFVTFDYMPENAITARTRRTEMRSAYFWIDQHLPVNAGILSTDDPLVYLSTGHRGNFAPILPRWWYADDHAKIVGFYKDVVPYCRTRGFEYVLATPADMSRWSDSQDEDAVERVMRENPQLEPLYHVQDGATIYHIRPL
jgi:hypothetical protein